MSPLADTPPPGASLRLLEFVRELRSAGVAVGTAEALDAYAALGAVPWQERNIFREALASSLAKSPEDRVIFDLAFERFVFDQAELQANRQDGSQTIGSGQQAVDRDSLNSQVNEALADDNDSAMRDLARLAVAAFGESENSGVLGVDLQRIRRELGLQAGQQTTQGNQELTGQASRAANRRFEKYLREELKRLQLERTGKLPPARPLGELARALPTTSLADLATVYRVTAQLKRRLATQQKRQGAGKRERQIDVRRTVRNSLSSGGVPIVLNYKHARPRKPELYVVCDISTSVSSAAVFFLSVMHALHDTFRKMRSFVFIERVAEITEVFQREREFHRISERITSHAGVADISGYTDYGRVWDDLKTQIEGDLDPRSTLIVLGDARTNGRDPGVETFATLAEKAHRAYWLNPEPMLYWNYGDSTIAAYEPYCEVFECWNAQQLEQFASVLALNSPKAT